MQQTLLDQNRFQIQSNILLSLLSQGVQLAAFGYCLFLLWTNAITFGTMTMFLQQRSALTAAMSELAAMVPNFLNSAVSAHRIRELTELPRDVHLSDAPQTAQTAGGLTVALRRVDFAYKDAPVLRDSSLVAAPSEIIALVGASGEGKTTLVRLMLGLVHPQSGEAILRTADGTEIPLNADTRHLFSYVPQGNTMISGTIADNLRLVRPDATPAEMEDALRNACAWEFVSAMAHGMDSEVGERGRGLSEGQAQRIAIARAILRDAPVMLLDEATSALDMATERRVLKNIVAACPGKTCIITTHRPSVLSLCRRVYRVMDTQVTHLTEEEAARMVMEF
jgi:ABC-type bacteriocin/lantibiotic exporter with double-glycine peptidase domain